MELSNGDLILPLIDTSGSVLAYKITPAKNSGELIVPLLNAADAMALKVIAMKKQDDKGLGAGDLGGAFAVQHQDSIFGPCVGCDEPSSFMSPRLQCNWPTGSDCTCYVGKWWYQCNTCWPENVPNPSYFYFEITTAVFSGFGASGKCSFTSKLLGCYPAAPAGINCGIMTPKEQILAALGF